MEVTVGFQKILRITQVSKRHPLGTVNCFLFNLDQSEGPTNRLTSGAKNTEACLPLIAVLKVYLAQTIKIY